MLHFWAKKVQMAEPDTFLQLQVKLPCIGVELGAIFGMAPKNLLLHLCLSVLSDPLTNALYAPARRNFTKYDPSHSPSVLSPR